MSNPGIGSTGYRTGETQGTIGDGGRRIWIYAKEVAGRWTRARTAVAWVLLAVYLGIPWIRWGGEPLLRVDIFARRLTVLSRHFWAQDLSIFLPAALAGLVLAFLITARFGRVWCGWACPQTVFLQFLFAPIERLIEGRASVRKERDSKPFTPDWLWRKAVKHGIFVACGALMGNTALAYLWGMDNLLYAIGHPSAENAVGLGFVIAFSAVFYFIFSWFKEQACVLICPYARFQSVLVDERTATVAYDTARGEPRGRGAKGSRAGLGDCVDCTQCVLVCPTGIDIRNGSQLECIGCTRCIDACDDTMQARKLPTGLIRYVSLAELQNKPDAGPRLRIPAYALLATLLFGTSILLLLRRDQVGVDVLRRGSAPYSVLKEGTVGNTFNVHFRNRRSALHDLTLRVEATAVSGETMRIRTNWDGRSFVVAGGQLLTLPLDVSLPAAAFTRGRLDARLVVSGEGLEESHPITLAGPWGAAGGTANGSP